MSGLFQLYPKGSQSEIIKVIYSGFIVNLDFNKVNHDALTSQKI